MTLYSAHLGDVVRLDGRDHELVGIRGREVQLRNMDTGAVVWMLQHDLWAEAERPALLPTTLGSVQHITESDDQARMAGHWLEVIDGTRPDEPDAPPRSTYDPATTTLTQRIQAKSQQLREAGFPNVSPRTVRRRVDAYQKEGQHGLVDGRTVRTSNVLGKADPRVLDALEKVQKAETHESTGTKTRLYERFKRQLLKDYGPEVPMPSYRTIVRYDGLMRAGQYTTAPASTRRTAAKRPQRAFTYSVAVRPGSRVEVDSTPLDVMVRDDDGKEYKAILTAAIDVATRSCCAFLLRPVAANGYDHAVLLARMLCPPPLEPGSKARRLMTSKTLPGKELADIYERLEQAPALPYIVPESVTIDCGADYRSRTFIDACRYLGIDVITANPGTPTDKPHVERFFNTVRTGFSQFLPGFTGGSPGHRGSSTKAVLNIHELDDLFLLWLTEVYQCKASDSLLDPLHPGAPRSPNQMYASYLDVMGCVPAPLTETDFIRLLPVEYRLLRATGVELGRRFYDSERLQPYRGGPTSRKEKFEVRYNPHNPMAIWVRVEPDVYVEVPLREAALYDAPFYNEITGELTSSAVTDSDTQGGFSLMDAIEEMHLDRRGRIVRDQDRRSTLSPVPRPKPQQPAHVEPDEHEGDLPDVAAPGYPIASEESF